MNPINEGLRLGLAAAIAASAEARQCSERLAGKTIAVETLDQRWLIVFEAGKARVESGDGEADATVRGSPTAVVGAFARDRDSGAAIFGNVELFEDFRSAFRPHLKLPEFVGQFAEDAGDACVWALTRRVRQRKGWPARCTRKPRTISQTTPRPRRTLWRKWPG